MKASLFDRCLKVIDANYVPQSRMFTSKEEIDYISELMGFSELDVWDMNNLRDMWVSINSNNDYHKDANATLRFSSVVAIIDHKIFNK